MLRFLGGVLCFIWLVGLFLPLGVVTSNGVVMGVFVMWSVLWLGPAFLCFWQAKRLDAKRLADAIAVAIKGKA